MLDERKLRLVELILAGENKSNIAKNIGIGRQTVYEWLKDPEVIKEISNRREEIIQTGKERLTGRLDIYLNELHDLATTSTDKRTKATVNMYLVDRILGKVSTVAEVPNDHKDDIPDDILEKEFDEIDLEESQLKIVK